MKLVRVLFGIFLLFTTFWTSAADKPKVWATTLDMTSVFLAYQDDWDQERGVASLELLHIWSGLNERIMLKGPRGMRVTAMTVDSSNQPILALDWPMFYPTGDRYVGVAVVRLDQTLNLENWITLPGGFALDGLQLELGEDGRPRLKGFFEGWLIDGSDPVSKPGCFILEMNDEHDGWTVLDLGRLGVQEALSAEMPVVEMSRSPLKGKMGAWEADPPETFSIEVIRRDFVEDNYPYPKPPIEPDPYP